MQVSSSYTVEITKTFNWDHFEFHFKFDKSASKIDQSPTASLNFDIREHFAVRSARQNLDQ